MSAIQYCSWSRNTVIATEKAGAATINLSTVKVHYLPGNVFHETGIEESKNKSYLVLNESRPGTQELEFIERNHMGD